MLFRSRCRALLLTVASLAAISLGCSTSSKQAANEPPKAAMPPGASSATPGSAEFSMGKELRNPIKVHLAYALWHEQQGNQIEARKSYDTVLKKNSKNIDAMLGLARLDMQLSRFEDAEKRLLRAQKLAPKSPEVATALGQFHSIQQNWPQALEHMQMARKLSPYDPVYAHQLGLVQARSGDLTAALGSFTEAVGAAEAHYNLGVILQDQGNLVAAEEHLAKALSLKSDLPQAKKLLTAVRQQRSGTKSQYAQAPTSNPETAAPGSAIQPAGYSQPATK